MTADALHGARVVVARSPEQAAPLLAQLTRAGARASAVPLVRSMPLADAGPLDRALVDLRAGRYDWCIVTSTRTLDALASRSGPSGVGAVPAPAEALAATRVAAVGPATARRAAELGVTVTLVPVQDHTARGLLHELVGPATDQAVGSDVGAGATRPAASGERARVLLPQSAIAAPTLADGLRAAGWDVDVVPAYTTLPVPALTGEDAARLTTADALVLASPSAVRALRGLAPDLVAPAVVCLGPTTAAAARSAGLVVTAVAERATPDAVVDATRAALTAPLVVPAAHATTTPVTPIMPTAPPHPTEETP